MKTTQKLINEWLNIEDDMKMVDEDDAEKIKELGIKQQELLNSMMEKVDNIDAFRMHIDTEIAKYRAIKDVYRKEVMRISTKVNSREKLKKHLNGVLIPSIIKTLGKDGKIQTSSARYTLYTGWGSLVYDKEKIHDKYKYVDMVNMVDTDALKKDAIAAQKQGEQITGALVPQLDRIRRS